MNISVPRFTTFVLLMLAAVGVVAADSQQLGYYRDPTLHGNNIVFTAEGDLWISSLSNSTPATRLTTHATVERSAKFSPNGEKIAFVASYHNLPAVYVINTTGGIAKQVTFELGRSKLHGWVTDNTLLISTDSDTGMHSSWALKTVNINDFTTANIPVSDAIEGTFSSDGNTLVFIQHGLQFSGDNANHYKGGGAGEMWRFAVNENKEAVLLSAEHEGSVRTPMLHETNGQSRIYFISNQQTLDNIWSMTLSGNDIQQHTKFTDWAVRNASIHGNSITFQHGADLKIFDITSGSVSNIDVSLQSDFVDMRTRFITAPLMYFESASISPNGKSAVVVARGQIAVANTQSSRLVTLATDPTSRNRSAIMSHNGNYIYAISDTTGDYEVWQFDAKGSTSAKQLTQNGKELKTALWLSPNGEWLAYTEKTGTLWLLNLSTGKSVVANESLKGNIATLVFSPDSLYFAATVQEAFAARQQIYLQQIPSGKSAFLTSAKYASFSPAFSADMQWLYFLSDRAFEPNSGNPWGDRNMGSVFDNRTEIFALALTEDAKFVFAAPTELDIPADKKVSENSKDKSGDDKEAKKVSVNIEFRNIAKRLWQLEVPAGKYTELLANDQALFVNHDKTLKSLALEPSAKLKDMTTEVTGLALSGDTKQLLVTKGSGDKTSFFIVPASATYPSDVSKNQVQLNKWILSITPQEEWQQLFKDAWLMHRDSLFDRNMRGLDWRETKQKYMPLLARITERSELNDIFEQMMGELNTLHSQVRGGDINEDPNAPNYATLGASYNDTAKGVEIDIIYQYDFEILSQAPSLAKPGVNAQAGDIISHVNRRSIATIADLHQALMNTSGQQTLLTLKRGNNTIETIVEPEPLSRESRLRYQHWATTKLMQVQTKNVDIGYLHLFAMGPNDLASFARDFYAQYQKQGLIIDVRRNRGGNIDSMLIEKLLRRAWSFWDANDFKQTNMQETFRGHLVVLADEFTYSDGETFTAGIRSLGIGTVIGKQTAGAGVWLSGNNRLVDGGMARVAEFPVFSMDGDWLTEGRGISPDIEVSNLPYATFNGGDAQLETAIALLSKKIKESPVPELNRKPFPKVEDAAFDATLIKK